MLAACDPAAGPAACGFGERATLGGCQAVDQLHVNLDERLQELNGTARRGIGANACTFRAFPHEPVLVEEECAAYVFAGEQGQEPYEGNGGAIQAALDEPVLMAPAEGQGCYASDLHPSRDDLFAPGDTIAVASLGGADFPPFEAELTAPETLALDTPGELTRGEAFGFEWIASDADVLLALVAAYDEEADQSANLACQFDDAAGQATLSAELMDHLPAGAAEADLYFYRQSWRHLEPADEEVAIDVVATSSVTKRVPLSP